MVRKITARGLNRNLGNQAWLQRDGIIGNSRYIDGRTREGQVFGVLDIDEEGNYFVKPFITVWEDGKGMKIDKEHFYDQRYYLRNEDVLSSGKGSFIVSGLENSA